MILDCHQYRFFCKEALQSKSSQRFLDLVPQAESLFQTSIELNGHAKRFWDKGIDVYPFDQEMFCHELGHCLDLVSRGQEYKLEIDNFGWPRVTPGKWSVKMAENECRVFTYQWLLQEAIGHNPKSGILCPGMTCKFLQSTVRYERDSNHFFELFGACKEELTPNFKEMLNKTVNYIVAAIDSERIRA